MGVVRRGVRRGKHKNVKKVYKIHNVRFTPLHILNAHFRWAYFNVQWQQLLCN